MAITIQLASRHVHLSKQLGCPLPVYFDPWPAPGMAGRVRERNGSGRSGLPDQSAFEESRGTWLSGKLWAACGSPCGYTMRSTHLGRQNHDKIDGITRRGDLKIQGLPWPASVRRMLSCGRNNCEAVACLGIHWGAKAHRRGLASSGSPAYGARRGSHNPCMPIRRWDDCLAGSAERGTENFRISHPWEVQPGMARVLSKAAYLCLAILIQEGLHSARRSLPQHVTLFPCWLIFKSE